MERLAMIMRIQAVVFGLYGLAFLLIPDFTLDTIFGWEGVETFWPRAVAVPFLGVAWLEWGVASRLDSRLDLVWPFALIPALFLVVFVWEKVADTYTGSDLFFWFSVVLVTVFAVAVAWARMSVGATESVSQ